ncbi:MAG: VWA domain-containing protein, partial [Deltaproteobacteria bacterium]|nr:VWA domain-containing protein [Deltaproteobacteria bacterium]
MTSKHTLLLIIALAITAGCSGLRLELKNASVQKPSNVALYFTVDTAGGDPVPGLLAGQFNIYEDGKLISTYESRQTILNPRVASARHTLLLLDMSGSVVDSGQVPVIQAAVETFVWSLGEQERVAIYAFDGREEITRVSDFETDKEKLKQGVAGLSTWKTKDPSTNLHGAVVQAAAILEEERDQAEVPLSFGTLVVFTDGTDRAHRSTLKEAVTAVEETDVGMFVIGLGGEVDQAQMERLGRDGFVHVDNQDAIVEAFHTVAQRILGQAARFYLLSYCSPSRAGQHRLTVEAVSGE